MSKPGTLNPLSPKSIELSSLYILILTRFPLYPESYVPSALKPIPAGSRSILKKFR